MDRPDMKQDFARPVLLFTCCFQAKSGANLLHSGPGRCTLQALYSVEWVEDSDGV